MKIPVYNDVLNPEIWMNENKLNSVIRRNLLKISYDFYKMTELQVPIKDIILIGSSANYNWSSKSDIDLHIVIDFNTLSMNKEDAEKLTLALKDKWNGNHNIKIKKHTVEIFLQDITKRTHATGLYSILKDKWLLKPKKENVEVDKSLIIKKYNNLASKINKFLKANDSSKLEELMEYLYNIREIGLDKSGELSAENIVFKLLRSNGYIQKLKDKITNLYDKSVSIKEINAINEDIVRFRDILK